MAKTLTVEVDGMTDDELAETMQLIAGKVAQGYNSGHEIIDTGRYLFDVKGTDDESADGETLVNFDIADALAPCLHPGEGVVLTESWSEVSDCGVMIVAIKNGRRTILREAEIGASLLATL